MIDVLGGREQDHRPVGGELAQLVESTLGLVRQLGPIAAAELIETDGIVAIPSPKRRTRGHLPQPQVKGPIGS